MWRVRERHGTRGHQTGQPRERYCYEQLQGKLKTLAEDSNRWLWLRTCQAWDAHNSSRFTSQGVNLKLKTIGRVRTHTGAIWSPRRRPLWEGAGKRWTTEPWGTRTFGGWQEDSKSEEQIGKAQQHKEDQACPVTDTKERGSSHNDRVEDGDEGRATLWWQHGHLAR